MLSKSLIFSSIVFLANSSFVNDTHKIFYQQTLKLLSSTPDEQNIINTFIDKKNTIWIVTETAIFYKTIKSNNFISANLDGVFNQNEIEYIKFVNINYSNIANFYFYVPQLNHDSGVAYKFFEVKYESDSPSIIQHTSADANKGAISAIWADDRGILIASYNKTDNHSHLLQASLDNVDAVNEYPAQPSASALNDNRLVLSILRTDKNDLGKNTIALNLSNANPYQQKVAFDVNPSYLVATNTQGTNFIYTDYLFEFGPPIAFYDYVIAKNPDGSNAYFFSGAASGPILYGLMKITITDNSFKYNPAIDPALNNIQTKNVVSIDDNLFIFSKSSLTNNYTHYDVYTSNTVISDIFILNPFLGLSDPKGSNANLKDFIDSSKQLEQDSNNTFINMPSLAVSGKTLMIGAGKNLYYLGEWNTDPIPDPVIPKSSNNTLIIVLAITLPVILIMTFAGGFYFYKKRKK